MSDFLIFAFGIIFIVYLYSNSQKPSLPDEYRDIIHQMKQETDEDGKVQIIILDKKRSKYIKAKATAEGVNIAEYIDILIDNDLASNGEK